MQLLQAEPNPSKIKYFLPAPQAIRRARVSGSELNARRGAPKMEAKN
jgi:hypothetical protein